MAAAVAEVLSVGTELLLGDILDTNAQFFARELAYIGINSYFRTTVGDNPERLKNAIKTALNRSDILITSGGLGPTPDDLTTECIAETLGAPLVLNEQMWDYIQNLFRERGFGKIPDSNKKQALQPDGADVLHNPAGTAPGIIWRLNESVLAKAGIDSPERPRLILTFPGVPSELKRMWAETAQPYLQEKFGGAAMYSIQLKHYGIGESALAEQYGHLLNSANPSVAPYAGRGECRLRVSARAATVEEAKLLCQPILQEIKAGSGLRCYGFDDDTLESVVGQLLAERNLTLSLAESCTGGLISELLTNKPGSSRYIKLNAVTYSNEAKTKLLGVPAQLLESDGAVSAQCARSMAEGMRELAGSDLSLSVTGIAGPDGGTPEKPVGTIFLGLSADKFYCGKKLNISPKFKREDIRYRTACEALNMVRTYLLEPDNYQNEAK